MLFNIFLGTAWALVCICWACVLIPWRKGSALSIVFSTAMLLLGATVATLCFCGARRPAIIVALIFIGLASLLSFAKAFPRLKER